METAQSIGAYLIERLQEHGVHHVFGVPGDYVLGFDKLLEKSPIHFINTCDEQGAGFAADAYARLRGLGAVCITYSVGGLKVANTTAQAYAEKSPVVVISGAPGVDERIQHPLLHHKIREFDTQYRVFQELTIASTVLDNPDTAFAEIDRVLDAALSYKRPVYIEIPRDRVNMPGDVNYRRNHIRESSNSDGLTMALAEATRLINTAQQPVILADIEIHRFGLQDALLQLSEQTHIPIADTLLGKSVISERHPNYLGLYAGALGSEFARQYVESSDCVIMLGVFLMDLNLGVFTAKLDPDRSIYVTSEKTLIQGKPYNGIRLQDFVEGLVTANLTVREPTLSRRVQEPHPFVPERDRAITVGRLFERLNTFLSDDLIVVADVGDSLFGGLDLLIHDKTRFLSPAYYASLGFAVPGGLGAQLANSSIRALILVGDGAFQMTGMELSTIARYGLNPIVIILNNGGYATERPMLDGTFNNIHPWRFSRITEVLNAGLGFEVFTEGELETALLASRAHPETFSILDVRLGSQDISSALHRLTTELGKQVSH